MFKFIVMLLLSLSLIRASRIDGKQEEGSRQHSQSCQSKDNDHGDDDKNCLLSDDHQPQKDDKASLLPRWNPRALHPCNIRQITWQQFLEEFGPSGLPPMYPDPLVIILPDEKKTKRNQKFQDLSQKDRILDSFPLNFTVTLSSSNSFSEHRRKIPFSQYLDELVVLKEDDGSAGDLQYYDPSFEPELEHQQQHGQSAAQSATITSTHRQASSTPLSNETWYLFGETYSPEWKLFLSHYELPLCEACLPDSVALSFGIGDCGSGVQWHVHGPGFSEAVIGRKHWILYQDKPDFHKDQTSLNWMEENYMNIMNPNDRPLECTLNPGDIIYFPNMWWHATINLDDYTAFVSTFTQEHLFV
ncbi:unnamed protein product [Cylindrotheca closterium]|uniref:JmjC domain-containing protein n=1 Tax=Cylindrotheca closterium TaxID=2856 RepID=A0AAD2FGV5_9STRA|nr:unnamed protein product [Cylindrotheca closterium]